MAKIIPPKELAQRLQEMKAVEGQTVVGESFRGQKWTHLGVVASTFKDCDFSNTRIDQACFGGGMTQSRYTDCNFDGAVFYANSPGNARFERCSFRNVKIHVFNGMMVELIDCVISGTIKKGFFNGTPNHNSLTPPLTRTTNEFHGNDFTGAKLLDVGFRYGIDLSLQQLPKGDDYIYVEDGRRFLQDLPSSQLADKYGNLFSAIERVLQMKVAEGQRQIFLSIKGFPAKNRPMLVELKHIAEGMLLA